MTSLRTPVGILSFPVLFTPRPAAPGGEPRFQINLLFDQPAQKTPEYAALRRAVAETIDAKWGPGKSQDKNFVGRLRLPFRKCEEKPYKGYQIPGGMYIAPWSKQRPGLVDANRQEIVVPEDIWPGQSVRATVSPFAYQTSGNMGVSFMLNNLQVCRTDGERLDGRRSALEEFDTWIDPNNPAPADADEEIPF
jgi:hypothetical protein